MRDRNLDPGAGGTGILVGVIVLIICAITIISVGWVVK